MTRACHFLLAPAASLLAAPLLAQTPDAADAAIDQAQSSASQPASDDVGASQITERSRTLIRSERSAAPARPVPQLTTERGKIAPGTQLSDGRSAEPSEPLSRPSEGRIGAVTRVEGDDRCEGDATAARPGICDRVIETRSAEFSRPEAPELSPEQRLLIDQRLREPPSMRVAGNRRFDPEPRDPNRAEDQAIAAAAFDRAGAGEIAANAATTRDASALPEASAALIEAILSNGATQTPR